MPEIRTVTTLRRKLDESHATRAASRGIDADLGFGDGGLRA